jgi:arylformamidase
MTKIFDITLTMYPGMVVWPGDPAVQMDRLTKIENGDNCNVTFLSTAVHAGTHVDAPYHFLADGTTIETLPLDVLVGLTQVIQIPDDVAEIDQKALEKVEFIPGITRVLFKTRNAKIRAAGEREFDTTFVAVSADAAEILLGKGVQLVGVDYLSVAPFKNSRPTHEILLGAKVVLLEGINLDAVEPGLYTLYCLPLKLAGSDGAPARTILVQD